MYIDTAGCVQRLGNDPTEACERQCELETIQRAGPAHVRRPQVPETRAERGIPELRNWPRAISPRPLSAREAERLEQELHTRVWPRKRSYPFGSICQEPSKKNINKSSQIQTQIKLFCTVLGAHWALVVDSLGRRWQRRCHGSQLGQGSHFIGRDWPFTKAYVPL